MNFPLKPLVYSPDEDYSRLSLWAEYRGDRKVLELASFVRHERTDARRNDEERQRMGPFVGQSALTLLGSSPENPRTAQADKPIVDAEIPPARIDFSLEFARVPLRGKGVSGKQHAEGEKRTASLNAASGLCELYPVVNPKGAEGAKNRGAAFDSESEVNGVDKGQTPPADSNFSLLTARRIVSWVVAGAVLGFSIFAAIRGAK